MHTAVTNTGHTHVSKNEASAMLTDVRFLHICICIPRAPRLCLEVDSPEEMKMMRKHMWGAGEQNRARGVSNRSLLRSRLIFVIPYKREGHEGFVRGARGEVTSVIRRASSVSRVRFLGFGVSVVHLYRSLSLFLLFGTRDYGNGITVEPRRCVYVYVCVCIYMRFTSHARYSTLYSTPDRCRLDRNTPIGNSQSCFLSSSSSYHLNTTERICS